jgi:hypothetical protein
MLDIGKRVLLHKVSSPDISTDVDEFVIATVVETRVVPYAWSSQRGRHGARAVTEDGREFTSCWNEYDDASMTPHSMWHGPDRIWFWMTRVPFYGKDTCPGVPWPVRNEVELCRLHGAFYFKDDSCSECDFEADSPRIAEKRKKEFLEQRRWRGWLEEDYDSDGKLRW